MSGPAARPAAALLQAVRAAATPCDLAGAVRHRILNGRDKDEWAPGRVKTFVTPELWSPLCAGVADKLREVEVPLAWEQADTQLALIDATAELCGHKAAAVRLGRERDAIHALIGIWAPHITAANIHTIPPAVLLKFADACVNATGALPGYLAVALVHAERGWEGAVATPVAMDFLHTLPLRPLLRWGLTLEAVHRQRIAGGPAVLVPCSVHDTLAPAGRADTERLGNPHTAAAAPAPVLASSFCLRCVVGRVCDLLALPDGLPMGVAEQGAAVVVNALTLVQACGKFVDEEARVLARRTGSLALQMRELLTRLAEFILVEVDHVGGGGGGGGCKKRRVVCDQILGRPDVADTLAKSLLRHRVRNDLARDVLAEVLRPPPPRARATAPPPAASLSNLTSVVIAVGALRLTRSPGTDLVLHQLADALRAVPLSREQAIPCDVDADLAPLAELFGVGGGAPGENTPPPAFLEGMGVQFVAQGRGGNPSGPTSSDASALPTPSHIALHGGETLEVAPQAVVPEVLRRLIRIYNSANVIRRIRTPAGAAKILKNLPVWHVTPPLKEHCFAVIAADAVPERLPTILGHLEAVLRHVSVDGRPAGDADREVIEVLNSRLVSRLKQGPALQKVRQRLGRVVLAQTRAGIRDKELMEVLLKAPTASEGGQRPAAKAEAPPTPLKGAEARRTEPAAGPSLDDLLAEVAPRAAARADMASVPLKALSRAEQKRISQQMRRKRKRERAAAMA